MNSKLVKKSVFTVYLMNEDFRGKFSMFSILLLQTICPMSKIFKFYFLICLNYKLGFGTFYGYYQHIYIFSVS